MKKVTILFSLIVLFSTNVFSAPSKIFMLRDNGPLRKDNGSNQVEWAETVRAGTELELASEEIVIKDLVTSSKTYNDVKFFEVKYNGQTYYVQESDAEKSDKLSVLQVDSILFSRPTLSAFRNAMLEIGTFVIAGESYTQFNTNFVKITFYDTNDGIKRTRYVNKANISTNEKDVKAIIMLENARATKDEDLKKEFLNNAKSMKTSMLIEAYISKEYNKILNVSLFSDDTIETISGKGYIHTEDGSKINVRDKPGTAGNVIGQIESANQPAVTAMMRTNITDEIDGETDFWYYIQESTSGLEGWIFGAYILFP